MGEPASRLKYAADKGAAERFSRLCHEYRNKEFAPLDDQARGDIIQFLVGRRADYCDLCGTLTTGENLSSWNEDGHVYCTHHGPLAEKMRMERPTKGKDHD